MCKFAKESDVSRQLQGLSKLIEKVQAKISGSLVEKNEFTRLEADIKKWTKSGFADINVVETNQQEV